MGKRVQALDFFRDEAGLLNLALYDPEKDQVEIRPLSLMGPTDPIPEDFIPTGPSISEQVIVFLAEQWGDRPPAILEADSAFKNIEIAEYLTQRGVTLQIAAPYSGCGGVRGALERKLGRLRKQTQLSQA